MVYGLGVQATFYVYLVYLDHSHRKFEMQSKRNYINSMMPHLKTIDLPTFGLQFNLGTPSSKF